MNEMSDYTIIQSTACVAGNNLKALFDVIEGKRAPGGYPVGIEGQDWFRLGDEYCGLTLEAARNALAARERADAEAWDLACAQMKDAEDRWVDAGCPTNGGYF